MANFAFGGFALPSAGESIILSSDTFEGGKLFVEAAEWIALYVGSFVNTVQVSDPSSPSFLFLEVKSLLYKTSRLCRNWSRLC